jgi:hypothetical protein
MRSHILPFLFLRIGYRRKLPGLRQTLLQYSLSATRIPNPLQYVEEYSLRLTSISEGGKRHRSLLLQIRGYSALDGRRPGGPG